jgi:phosphoglycerate dehydrogenase-like enzyme
VVGTDQLNYLLEQSDYVVVALALTKDTKHFIKASNLEHCKAGQVLINIGRGALIDEDALIQELTHSQRLRAAALDVFTVEPLPESSALWSLSNVLISPHNADHTCDARHRSVKFFTENCHRFLANEELECVVNKHEGY